MTYSITPKAGETATGLSGMGVVTKEEHTKDAGLFNQPLPGSGSEDVILLDIFGATRNITVNGVFVDGTGGVSLTTFIGYLDGLVHGSQTGFVYTSDKSGHTYNVLIIGISWNAEEGAVGKVDYTFRMVEGSV